MLDSSLIDYIEENLSSWRIKSGVGAIDIISSRFDVLESRSLADRDNEVG